MLKVGGDGHTSSLGITYATLADQYPLFFRRYWNMDWCLEDLTAILETGIDRERERIFFIGKRFRLLSTNAWYLSLSVSIKRSNIGLLIVDPPPSVLNRISLDAACKGSCIFRSNYISIPSRPGRNSSEAYTSSPKVESDSPTSLMHEPC